MNGPADRASRSLDLFVTGVTDHDDGVTTLRVALGLQVYLGDERARCVDDLQVPTIRFIDHRLGDAMRTEHRHCAFGNVGDVIDEDRATRCKVAHDVSVVDDLVIDVHRSAEALQCLFGDIDRPRNTRAEAAGLCEQNVHQPATFNAASVVRTGFTALADLAAGAAGVAAGCASASVAAAAPSVASAAGATSGIGLARCNSG